MTRDEKKLLERAGISEDFEKMMEFLSDYQPYLSIFGGLTSKNIINDSSKEFLCELFFVMGSLDAKYLDLISSQKDFYDGKEND